MNALENRSSFALEKIAADSVNYYERLVDSSGLPYFNVFWGESPEAAHDWPDFGDVMARQLQAAVMLRHMTGRGVSTEKAWRSRIFASLDSGDGLMYRPQTSFSKHEADWGDAALTLYALITAWLDDGDTKLKDAIGKMVGGLLARAKGGDMPNSGFAVKSLMTCERHLKLGSSLELAKLIVRDTLDKRRSFSPENKFRGHMHGELRFLVGLGDYALYVGDAELFSRVRAVYGDVRSFATKFGFLPENVWRKSDCVACETCALMDYAGLGATLANHGHPELWDDMERLMRNHLVESQVRDASWLGAGLDRDDTAQFSWRDIASRSVGAWAGWSSPNHILACRETLNAHWGGPELKNKTRALQNCCGGSGVHALFILWKNAARFVDGRLWVHMHLDKLLPQAEIRCLQPYSGVLRIRLKASCQLSVRVPDFARTGQIKVSVNGVDSAFNVWGNYLELERLLPGDMVEIQYPLPVFSTDESVGNPGYRRWNYRVTWKGDTVVKMEPVGNDCSVAYSDFDKRDVPVFYGVDGPGPLYRREHLAGDSLAEPAMSELHEDSGSLDLWRFN